MSWPPGWDASCNANVVDIAKHEKSCVYWSKIYMRSLCFYSVDISESWNTNRSFHHMFEFLMMATNKALCDPVFLFFRKEHAHSNVASSTPNILHI